MDETIMADAERFFDYVMELLEKYESFGPLPGILLPFIEAFLPFLPLFVFVMANSVAYGLFKGFFYSWLGTSFGSLAVFSLIRKFGHSKLFIKIKQNKQVQSVTSWVERHGFSLLFIFICFPFSPSSVINVVSGLSKVNTKQFILATFFGNAVMIFSIAYVGTSIVEFAKHPTKTIVVTVCIVVFWFFGKVLEKKLLNQSNVSKGSK